MVISLCEKLDFPAESGIALEKAYRSITENPETYALFQSTVENLLRPNEIVFTDLFRKLEASTTLHPYVLNAVLCLFASEPLRTIYADAEKTESFEKHIRSLKNQLLSCKEKHGVWGLSECFWQWMFHQWQCHRLGRLEFEPFHHCSCVSYQGIKRGDPVVLIHIPSGKPLDIEEVMESLALGYDLFKDRFENGIVPFMTHSWLLYPPYLNGVFKKGGNLEKFAALFDIISQNEEKYVNFSYVFGCGFPGEDKLDTLPQKTSLQRNMLAFIKQGNSMGQGYGIFFYDKNGIVGKNDAPTKAK